MKSIDRVEIFPFKRRASIVKCSGCTGSSKFRKRYRKLRSDDCSFVNNAAPSLENGISIIYLGEAPRSSKHIYNPKLPIDHRFRSLSMKIINDLFARGELDENWNSKVKYRNLDEKSLFIKILQSRGIIVIDCCHCSLDDVEDKRKFIRQCFEKHTKVIIKHLLDSYENIEIRPCYMNTENLLHDFKLFQRITPKRTILSTWKKHPFR